MKMKTTNRKRTVPILMMLTFALLITACLAALPMTVSAAEGEPTIVTTEDELTTALATGGNIKLGADITATGYRAIAEGTTVVLDLSGYTLDFNQYALRNYGTFEICDSGSGGSFVGIANNVIANYGRFTLTSGTVSNNAPGNYSSTIFAIYNASEGELIINGGTVTGENNVIDIGGGSVTINGGTISLLGTQGNRAIYNKGSLTVTSGEINGSFGIDMCSGTIEMTGGTIYAQYGMSILDGTVTISGGKISDSTINPDYPGVGIQNICGTVTFGGSAEIEITTNSGEGIQNNAGTVNMSDGTITATGTGAFAIVQGNGQNEATFSLSGGTITGGIKAYSGTVADCLAPGYLYYDADGSVVTLTEVQTELTGTFTVAECTNHSGGTADCDTLAVCELCKLEYGTYYHADDDQNGFCDECGKLPITEVTFPDANFRTYITEKFDTDKDGLLSNDEIAAVTEIKADGKGIESLSGVEHFTNLQYLYVFNNSLTTLDVSGNKALTVLHCGQNQLTALDVSQNTELVELSCYGNLFTSLDVSANKKLEILECSDCPNLTSLKVNTAIIEVKAGNTALRSLDLSECGKLESIHFINTYFTSIELPAHFVVDPFETGKQLDVSQIWLDIDQKTMVLDLRDFVADVSRITYVSENATIVGNYLYISVGATQVYYEYDTGAAEGSYPLTVFININNPHSHSFDRNEFCADCGLQATIRVDAFEEKCFFTSSFADALALASEGTADAPVMPASITLFADVTVDEAVTMTGGDVRLELNGHTLTVTATNDTPFTLIAGTFTIRDSSTAQTGTIYHGVRGNEYRTVIALIDSATLVLESGTLDFIAVTAAISVEDGSIMQQRGGKITTPILLNNGRYELDGGTIETTYPYAFIVDSDGSAWYYIEITGGTVSVNDTSGSYGLLDFPQNGCIPEIVSITGGTFQNTSGKPFMIRVYHSDAQVSITGGVFEQGLICTALYKADPISLSTGLASGYAFYDADGNLVVLTEDQTEIAEYVTVGECTHIIDFNTGKCNACGDKQYLLGYKQDDKYYYFDDFVTGMAKIDEINIGPSTVVGTIKLYADITVNETVTVLAEDWNYLDLNGKTLKFISAGDTCWIISEDSYVFLQDSSTEQTGKVIFDMTAAPTCAGLTVVGRLEINDVTIEAIGGYALAVSGEVKNYSKINGSILMQNGGRYIMQEASVNTTDEMFVIDENASEWTIELLNGTFENGIKVGELLTLKDILPIGGAFGDENGNFIDLEEGQREIAGKVTLIACPHQSKYLRLNSNDNGTHDMVCTFCQVITSDDEECSYQRYIKSSMLISAANCTSPEIYYMSCACGRMNGETFEDGYTNPNVHTSEEKELISNHDGTHNVVHSCCKAVITENASCIPADCTKASLCDCGYSMEATHTEHDFSGAYSYNDEYHWRKCQNCNETSERDYHYGQNSGDCTKPTLCECGYVVVEAKEHSSIETFYTDDYHYEGCLICTMPVDDVRTPHDFSILCHDEYDHWYQCSGCEKESVHIEHSGDNGGDCTKDSICSCEYVTKTGETAHDFSGEYLSDAEGHYHKCANCDVIDEKLAHTPEDDDGTCLTAVHCSICNAVTTAAKNDHAFDNDCDTTCGNKGCTHTREITHTPREDDGDCTTAIHCAVCDAMTTPGNASHSFDNSCDTDCNREGCDHTRTITHTPCEDDGDCTTPVLCSICNEIATAAKEHAFDNSCDTTCGNKGCTHTRKITHTPRNDDGDCTTAIHCAVCDAMTTPGNPSHDFSGDYLSDSEGHWHDCADCGATDTKVEHSGTEDGFCDVCAKFVVDGVVTDVSLSLDGDIGINFYWVLSDDVINNATAYFLVTLPNGDTEQIPVTSDLIATPVGTSVSDRTYYKVTGRVAAKEMAENIKVELVVDNASLASAQCSVRGYAERAFGFASENPGSVDEKLITMMKAMLNYGAASQILFDHNTGDLANSILSDDDKIVADVNSEQLDDVTVNANLTGIKNEDFSCILETKTTIRHYFSITEGTVDDYYFAVEGREVTPVQITRNGKTMYYVDITDIAAKDMDYVYTFMIVDKNYNASYVYASVYSYMNAVIKNKDNTDLVKPELVDTINAMYAYGFAAYSYFR